MRSIITEKTFQNEVINGTNIQNSWFPKIEANVFISHSHQDQEMAQNLAAWFYKSFGIISFIDSDIWGYANDLLKQIDDKFCRTDNQNVCLYSYEKRNFSTAHVHAMLSNALIQMIDQTECLFFLNTPNSISVENTVNNKTTSPWLYLELIVSQFIRQRIPEYLQPKTAGIQIQKFPQFQYDIDLSHLPVIKDDELRTWESIYIEYKKEKYKNSVLGYYFKSHDPLDALKALYCMKPIKKEKNFNE
jgi:hypothetical protein